MIAHRISTLDVCDRLMVVRNGEIIAFDTPSELAKNNEFYKEAIRLAEVK